MIYAEAAFGPYHFAHIAAREEHLRLQRIERTMRVRRTEFREFN